VEKKDRGGACGGAASWVQFCEFSKRVSGRWSIGSCRAWNWVIANGGLGEYCECYLGCFTSNEA